MTNQNGRFSILSLVLLALYLSGCAVINVDVGSIVKQGEPLKETMVREGGADKILILDVEGVISNQVQEEQSWLVNRLSTTSWITQNLNMARKDKNIRALILRINSPGGTVTACDIIYSELLRYKKETQTPIIALMGDISASGGYYLASAADYIVAHPSTITGSIGVIFMGFSLEGLMDKVGVKGQPVKSGTLKDIGSPFKNMSAEEKKVLQAIIDENFQQFLKVVKDGRQDLTPQDITVFSDARILTAKQAKDLHLVDAIGGLEDAILKAEHITHAKSPRLVMYHRSYDFIGDVYSHSPQAMSQMNVFGVNAGQGDFIPKSQFMYLWLPPNQ